MEFPCIVPHFASIRAVIGRKRAGAPRGPGARPHIPRGKISISGSPYTFYIHMHNSTAHVHAHVHVHVHAYVRPAARET